LLAVWQVKNLFNVLMPFFLAKFATFLDGSIPKILFFLDLKFFKKDPSFEPISITFIFFLKYVTEFEAY